MVHEGKRQPTVFTSRDNMLDIWKQITELGFRGFGLKPRKMPKIPKNFQEWSQASQQKWMINNQKQVQRKNVWDTAFITNESRILDGLCRKIVYLLDRAYELQPKYLSEWQHRHSLQNDAIGYCYNLKRELNHIAETIPCNKNFLTIQTENVKTEIELLQKWRKECNNTRMQIVIQQLKMRKKEAKKAGIIINEKEFQDLLKFLDNKYTQNNILMF